MSDVSRARLQVISWVMAAIIGGYGIWAAIDKTKKDAAKEVELQRAKVALARERADNLAYEAEEMMTLYDSSNYGYARLDENGLVTKWNTALARWTGYSEGEMIGRDLRELMAKEKRDAHTAGYQQIINDPKAKGRTYVVECELIPRAPNKKPVNVRVNARVIENKSGERFAIAMVDRLSRVVDIGDRTPQAEAAK